MITFLLALAAVFMVCVTGMILAAILDPGEALPTCPECGEPHDQEQCTWFHTCPHCPHIRAAWTRTEAETDKDRHAEVCPGRKGLLS